MQSIKIMEEIEKQKLETMNLKDNSKRAKRIVIVFWGICLLNLMAVISGYLELELLEKIRAGDTISEQEANANDLRQSIIGIVQTGFYIASVLLFLSWFRRAYGNLHRMRIKNLEYSETMTIWSFIIPIISLYRPYKIAKEIIIETRKKLSELTSNYKFQSNLSILGVWWGLFLITNYIGQFALRSVFKNETIDQFITSTQAYMVSDFMDIPTAIVTILMIKQISRDENVLFKTINTNDNKAKLQDIS